MALSGTGVSLLIGYDFSRLNAIMILAMARFSTSQGWHMRLLRINMDGDMFERNVWQHRGFYGGILTHLVRALTGTMMRIGDPGTVLTHLWIKRNHVWWCLWLSFVLLLIKKKKTTICFTDRGSG